MCAPSTSPFPPLPPAPVPMRGVRLTFSPGVDFHEVELTLELSLLATRSLHGDDAVCLDADYELDRAGQSVTINTNSKAGRTLALTFLGFTRREFGDDAVSVFRFAGGSEVRP